MDQQVIDRQEEARRNREAMPLFSAWLAEWGRTFGPMRVLFAHEGELERGKRLEDRLVNGRWPT